MARLDNRDPHGNLLAEYWKKLERQDPTAAQLVRDGIDKGQLESLDFYNGANHALIKMAELVPDLTRGQSEESKIYLMCLAYTEHQMRNT